MNHLNCKLYRLRNLPKIEIDLDIPVISMDNAIVFDCQEMDYQSIFNLGPIQSGLMLYKGRYYYFLHDIINTPKSYGRRTKTNHSYNIYPILDVTAQEIIECKKVNRWKVQFEAFYYFGEYYLSIGSDDYNKFYKYISFLTGRGLFMPYPISPSEMEDGVTIGKFMEDHLLKHRFTGLQLNMSVWRDIKLELLN